MQEGFPKKKKILEGREKKKSKFYKYGNKLGNISPSRLKDFQNPDSRC